jgi:hypothetical protein
MSLSVFPFQGVMRESGELPGVNGEPASTIAGATLSV